MSADVWVAVVLPYSDGSGEAEVLGVYSSPEGAEARCWRHGENTGLSQPTAVIERRIDYDYEDAR